MNEYTKSVKEFFMISNRIDESYYRHAAHYGISFSESIIIYSLLEDIASNQKEISDIWGLQKTTVNSAIKKAIKNGYINLENKENKRKHISFTEEGLIWADRISEPIYRAEETAMRNTSEALREKGITIEDVLSALSLFADNLKTAIDHELESGNE